jgi:hypothetical protein
MMEVINLREDRYPIRRKHVTVAERPAGTKGLAFSRACESIS